MSDLFSLKGKVALLTGAEAAAQLRAQDLDAIAVPCDAMQRRQIEALFRQTLALRGRIDVLVCNAGVAPPLGPLAATSDADWDRTMTINLRSAVWLSSLVIPAMASRRDGSVILTASLSSLRGNKSIGLYGLSKAALAQLARNLAVEWGPANVRVNAISPGLIATEFARPLLDNPELLSRRLGLTPLRRAGEPHEIAGVAVMLASRAGAFITGQNPVVDGGTIISDGN
jgi:NAD(P)-dependent dehydrogenase (short-subunit alcohol dehydrogenase family)